MSDLAWTTNAKGPKSRRMAEARFHKLLWIAAHEDNGFLHDARREVPDAWRTLEFDLDVEEPKQKVTLYLDRSVARLFRAMGKGYQARINRILATWMQMKIAEKAELAIDLAAQLRKDAAARNAADPAERIEDARRTLAESWAYNEGLTDGLHLAGGSGGGREAPA